MTLTLDDLTPEQRARVEAEIDPDEQIFWIGRPNTAPSDLAPIVWVLLSICAVGLATAMLTAGALGKVHGPWFMFGPSLLAIVFVAICYNVIHSTRSFRSNVYLVTDRRAIIMWESKRSLIVHMVNGSEFKSLRRNEELDGSGDLIFEQNVSLVTDEPEATFFNIPDVKRVYDLVRSLATPPADESA